MTLLFKVQQIALNQCFPEYNLYQFFPLHDINMPICDNFGEHQQAFPNCVRNFEIIMFQGQVLFGDIVIWIKSVYYLGNHQTKQHKY